jgi:hypothetical protein
MPGKSFSFQRALPHQGHWAQELKTTVEPFGTPFRDPTGEVLKLSVPRDMPERHLWIVGHHPITEYSSPNFYMWGLEYQIEFLLAGGVVMKMTLLNSNAVQEFKGGLSLKPVFALMGTGVEESSAWTTRNWKSASGQQLNLWIQHNPEFAGTATNPRFTQIAPLSLRLTCDMIKMTILDYADEMAAVANLQYGITYGLVCLSQTEGLS